MMSTLWTVAAVCLCLGGHPRSETSELKKAIVRMPDNRIISKEES